MVRLQTSYVPSDTVHKFITVSVLRGSGFQSSKDVSKSSANRRQRPTKRPLLTKDPDEQAEIIVDSKVITTAAHESLSTNRDRFRLQVA